MRTIATSSTMPVINIKLPEVSRKLDDMLSWRADRNSHTPSTVSTSPARLSSRSLCTSHLSVRDPLPARTTQPPRERREVVIC